MTDDADAASPRAKVPTQARSIATFANILRAASDLIIEQGIEALTTNAVAQRANVNIGTLYHYFPGKRAILHELFRAHQEQRSSALLLKLAELPTTPDVAIWCRELFDDVDRDRRSNPSHLVLRRAFLSLPDLVAADDLEVAETQLFVADVLQQRCESLETVAALAAAKVIVGVINAFRDSAPDDAALRGEVLRQQSSMLDFYLAQLGRPTS
jgi:AcrR family transcriptional regulator